jgi:hypothetical protein
LIKKKGGVMETYLTGVPSFAVVIVVGLTLAYFMYAGIFNKPLPSVRIDICFYWVVIACVSMLLLFRTQERMELKKEILGIRDKLLTSAIVELPGPLAVQEEKK